MSTATLPSYATSEVLTALAQHATDAGHPVSPEAAAAVLEAAQSAGLLVEDLDPPQHEITDEDVAETAKWVARLSDHPRYYADALGWQALMQSEGNIIHAHAAAAQRVTADERNALNHAKTLLIDYVRRASGGGS